MENFADAPLSIAEHKAGKSHDAKDWTPRDVLVELLRGIDRGGDKTRRAARGLPQGRPVGRVLGGVSGPNGDAGHLGRGPLSARA